MRGAGRARPKAARVFIIIIIIRLELKHHACRGCKTCSPRSQEHSHQVLASDARVARRSTIFCCPFVAFCRFNTGISPGQIIKYLNAAALSSGVGALQLCLMPLRTCNKIWIGNSAPCGRSSTHPPYPVLNRA